MAEISQGIVGRRLEPRRLGVDTKSIQIPSKNLERVLVSFQVLLYASLLPRNEHN